MGRVAERMGKHRHEPIRRVDPIVAAPSAYVCVTREDCAVQHEHVLAEHEHAAVHRRRIGQPACAGAFAAHWLSKIDGGLHFHPCRAGGRRGDRRRVHLFVLMLIVLIVLVARAIEVNRPYLGRWALSACSRFIGVGRLLAIHRSWVFSFRQRHQFHPAFRAITWLICDDFGMHEAGVFLLVCFLLLLLMLVIVLVIGAIGVP